ncbi:MAG: cytoplasmic protein [Rhizobiaceae bacterium]
MNKRQGDADKWRRIGDEWAGFSRASVALQLAVGADLKALVDAPIEIRQTLLPRVRRALRREHMRGIARHWSYDLNRHIALKQALDYLSLESECQKITAARGAAVMIA